ncbi:MAG: hypothetical protein AAF413_01210 [Patescibacteria group bacterium]
MKQILSKVLVGFTGLALFVSLFLPAVAQEVVQGFASDEQLQRGQIVGLIDGEPVKVTPVQNDELERMHGVVVDASDAPLLISDEESDVYVATTGRYGVLVTDTNGPIKQDDYISLSSVVGVGQLAAEDQALVIGKAAQDFVPDQGSLVLSTTDDGSGRTVNVGRILVDLQVSRNPNKVENIESVPGFIRNTTETIAGKPVTPVRTYISILILILVTAISGSLIYASVKSSIVAIGRNPLSKRSITKSLIQVVGIAFIVLISGLFAVYLMLKL